MYTDLPWDDTGKEVVGKSNSFVYKFDLNRITTFKHQSKAEVVHSKYQQFAMANGPFAVWENRTAFANLGNNFTAPENTKRRTVLCGELQPELLQVEIF